uniref:Peptidase S1 domain-containing protein n=1 Tax=Stomoxys calcitrans TaxID=35570 RepID=A0A1I8NZT7_STOCA
MHTQRIPKHLLFCLLWLIHQGNGAENLNDTAKMHLDTNSTPFPPLFPQGRIVNGNSANERQFPYQVSLRYHGYHICGGSILSQNYVVTAAHCVKNNPAWTLTIRAGSRLVNSGGQVVRVSEVKIHPSYRNFGNDIALLKLSQPVKFNDTVKAIALARKAPPSGAAVLTSGWGRLGKSIPNTPRVLQYTILNALTNGECKRRLLFVEPNILCLAHPAGKGVCSGDSGGPAVYKNELVGVTNYVVAGCASAYPDGYANVAYHYNWLKSNAGL